MSRRATTGRPPRRSKDIMLSFVGLPCQTLVTGPDDCHPAVLSKPGSLAANPKPLSARGLPATPVGSDLRLHASECTEGLGERSEQHRKYLDTNRPTDLLS